MTLKHQRLKLLPYTFNVYGGTFNLCHYNQMHTQEAHISPIFLSLAFSNINENAIAVFSIGRSSKFCTVTLSGFFFFFFFF